MKLKKLFSVIVFFLIGTSLPAQEAQNRADLDFLYNSILKLPSYKDQLKNDKAYHQLYENMRKDLKSSDEFEIYLRLLQLIYPIKDNHLGLWRKPDSSFRFKYLKERVDEKEVMSKYEMYPVDSLEGIYIRPGNADRYVLFRKMENVYYLLNFKTGIVELILNQSNNQTFDAIRFMGPPVPYVLYRNVKLTNGKLTGLNFQKLLPQTYAPINFGDGKYEYKVLEHETGYLRLSTFSSGNENIKIATDFFTKASPTINTRYLIVDLRNNGGGGDKTSGQFYKFLKKYDGEIFILQNSNTVSNAEQFIINIKSAKKITTLGELTRGTITYGSNYGKTIDLPSKRFLFYPTDMKGRSKDLAYENTGIKPDISLDAFGEDWIKQTIKYIKAK
ncbi:S41 family peptidase [Pedobacter sp. Leaf176]|uniref:S41 family peptidase n=1 Tax=Pedobacter sp. Leaf176 TaxID=1736286 RepID=UPI0006F2B67A|nr:S41 family peptidase [Pedobacter sp. Leaf176]KQR67329.1 hypothetical protein ASF92_16625 [Pedobacter sp. Leaf176]